MSLLSLLGILGLAMDIAKVFSCTVEELFAFSEDLK